MDTKMRLLTVSLAFLFSSITYCHACSCMLTHPQERYCKSDFVILARVKKDQVVSAQSKVYKVRVRKEFKMSEKGLVALKDGRLHTAVQESMCGVDLQIGKLYVISGYIHSLKAYIGLCDMIMEWNTVTRRQRKGLKMLYKRGCTCRITNCMYHRCGRYRQRDTCMWRNHCETRDGICLRQAHGSCMWNKNKMITQCRQGLNSTLTQLIHSRTPPIP